VRKQLGSLFPNIPPFYERPFHFPEPVFPSIRLVFFLFPLNPCGPFYFLTPEVPVFGFFRVSAIIVPLFFFPQKTTTQFSVVLSPPSKWLFLCGMPFTVQAFHCLVSFWVLNGFLFPLPVTYLPFGPPTGSSSFSFFTLWFVSSPLLNCLPTPLCLSFFDPSLVASFIVSLAPLVTAPTLTKVSACCRSLFRCSDIKCLFFPHVNSHCPPRSCVDPKP